MEKLKQSIVPFLIGAVVGMIVLSQVFGFMSNGSAQALTDEAVEEAVVLATAPACIANGRADEALLAEVMSKSSYQRRGAVADAGWATYPADASPGLKRAIDQACVDGLAP